MRISRTDIPFAIHLNYRQNFTNLQHVPRPLLLIRNHIRRHPKTLTKAPIVETISEQNGFPKNQSSKIIEILLELIKNTLELGEDVLISGFGRFCVKEIDIIILNDTD